MKFDTPAGQNPIDQLRVVGQPVPRIDGPFKTTGTAPYAYERHDAVPHQAYGWIVGSAIAKGRVKQIYLEEAESAPGVLAIVTHETVPAFGEPGFYKARPLADPTVQHYHQAVALVVAETFEQARHAASLIRVDYEADAGRFDLGAACHDAVMPESNPDSDVGDFHAAFAAAPVQIDETYRTPDQSHFMLEPHATIAAWDGDDLTIWSSQQILTWAARDLAGLLGIDKERIRVVSTFVGGGFGSKGTVNSDAVLATLGARAAGRPVKVALPRPLMPNNTTHRAATVQRIRIGADESGRISAIAHESWSGNIPGGMPETAASQTKLLYASANRHIAHRLARLDLPEASAMRAPGEAPGMMALEIAMDELAEKVGIDPVNLRVLNDTEFDPMKPDRRFSSRPFVECLRTGAAAFGWSARRPNPGSVRENEWLIGLGMASAIRGAPTMASRARVRLEENGRVTVETDMTDIGTGSYTIIGQTAAEMMGVSLDCVDVRLGDTDYPPAAGSGGQFGAASATGGVYAACMVLREQIARALDLDPAQAVFADGRVRVGNVSCPLGDASRDGPVEAEDGIEFGDLKETYAQQTFGAHFCEVGVNAFTGEVRVRRMLAVCAAGRIINPLQARSQVIGGMTMGIGAALTEELVVDRERGFFVNHDFASYEVPTHADVPHLDVLFIDEDDPYASPLKAKGVGELGISGVAAAIANALHNAVGVRIRDYPITLDKYLARLPEVA